MKIVLKTNNGGEKNLDKSDDKNELTKNEFKKPQNSILNLAFGLKGDNTLDNDHEIDGKHFLSRNKPENSKPTFDSLKARKFAKALDYSDKANSDLDLDPQLYLYDELVPDRNTEESAKFKYLGFVDESKNISSLDLNNDSQGRTGKSDDKEPEEQVESKKESRYMSKMVTVARKRQMERDIAFEKQLLKEELKSDSNIGEVFVTGAYKKKLEERKLFEEEQKKKEEYDAVHSKNSLTKLHTYLLKTGFAKRSSTDNPNH
ncbi:Coiled-coil domain-containing protein 55 (DUF2040) family protein [Theileria parva strain Muguga]|uniref:Coiled-coil domain-containing protein 55 (DUF2040) family protein n=1 Tax=Theileria parva strain Muguga TaxID=333668 RepID=UPI001C61F4C2|nr:Coiled-coil domain-containing protein 55 (DUF2040) family protein [Theileria parva strain Muguga]EAN32264.2 Coiled-coil domain-containing protein 55 (DUF2040) family protein [Theileria parva strain Muguga]